MFLPKNLIRAYLILNLPRFQGELFMFLSRNFELEAKTFEEWEKWEVETKSKYPIRWMIFETIPRFFRRIINYIFEKFYQFRCKWYHKYNVVRCCHLSPVWHDRDVIMLHAAFQVLEDFVEKELPEELAVGNNQTVYNSVYNSLVDVAGHEYASERAGKWSELKQLYDWWQDRVDSQDKQDDDAMLHRLVNVRKIMWT